jgi:alkanesulfonate monooxygenase SsuD/methylene tetrahydromethanopterin reductase-like flavin-dependent oxidoreductase (luciferase family)
VVVVVDPDVERGYSLAAGSITFMARFSVMHGRTYGPIEGATRTALEALPANYEMSRHFSADNKAAEVIRPSAEAFAIVGPASHCRERPAALAELGVDRFHVVGPPGSG